MKRAAAIEFARAELACMRASVAALLERYARPGTDFARHLIAADSRLESAEVQLSSKDALRVRPQGRYGGPLRGE